MISLEGIERGERLGEKKLIEINEESLKTTEKIISTREAVIKERVIK